MTDSEPFLAAMESRAHRREDRRAFFRAAAGMAVAGTALAYAASAEAQTATVSDADILNFALNLEYLEAQFYSFAVNGVGLASTLLTGTGNQGAVTGGRQVDFTGDPIIGRMAKEIAADEAAHVAFLRQQLGTASAVAQPALDISANATGAFSKVAAAAGIVTSGTAFDPYASIDNFLLAAYIFEDVGVTAYKGAASLISNKTYLEAAAGIMAVEAPSRRDPAHPALHPRPGQREPHHLRAGHFRRARQPRRIDRDRPGDHPHHLDRDQHRRLDDDAQRLEHHADHGLFDGVFALDRAGAQHRLHHQRGGDVGGLLPVGRQRQHQRQHRGIANVHFGVSPPTGMPRLTGVVNGLSDWILAHPDRISVTVSAADPDGVSRHEFAHRIWSEVSYVTGRYMTGLPDAPPPWQVIRERRATFAATPEAARLRPRTRTEFRNLLVAGDWTDTGLPACIEGAIRSGEKAARLAMETNGLSARTP